MIVSAEMYLYGGLIASRISNDTFSEVDDRLQKLLSYTQKYPKLDIYVSNVVMRIPSYDGDFEEPWYWAQYGDELFTYSFYLDKYNQLKNIEDLIKSKAAVKNVPSNAVDEFKWRRARNHDITMKALAAINQNTPSFRYFYTTLDDSAEYGFNIREAQEIRDFITSNQTSLNYDKCPLYPGADEVHLAMLAKFSVVNFNKQNPITLAAVFRNESNVRAIPGYEGQPMIDTLEQQIAAAGGALLTADDYASADAILLVNNFNELFQKEAPEQIIDDSSSNFMDNYQMFDKFIAFAFDGSTQTAPIPVGFCDNYYVNGGDYYFLQYMSQRASADHLRHVAYAGWNTNGNTIGTVVANTIVLKIFGNGKANAQFNSLRILEDMFYQATTRQVLKSYADQITNAQTGESSSYLSPDLVFYERFIFKLLESKYTEICRTYDLPYKLDSVYFPWNRTFEIGLRSSVIASSIEQP